MANLPFWKGKNSKLIFVLDNAKVVLDVMSWDITRNATEINEGVCGEDRDRLDDETNYFDWSLTVKMQKLDALEAMLEDQENQDQKLIPLVKGVGVLIKPNDGTQKALQAGGEISIGAWALRVGGRTERNEMTIPLRSQYVKELPI